MKQSRTKKGTWKKRTWKLKLFLVIAIVISGAYLANEMGYISLSNTTSYVQEVIPETITIETTEDIVRARTRNAEKMVNHQIGSLESKIAAKKTFLKALQLMNDVDAEYDLGLTALELYRGGAGQIYNDVSQDTGLIGELDAVNAEINSLIESM